MNQRSFSPAGTVLDGLFERLEFREQLRAHYVWNLWPDVVGDLLARRAEPIRIQDGRLFVRVTNSTWMQELQLLQDEIRTRLNDRLGAPVVREIYLVLGRPKRNRRRGEQRKPFPVDENEVAALVPETGHPELDETIRRVARARVRRMGPL